MVPLSVHTAEIIYRYPDSKRVLRRGLITSFRLIVVLGLPDDSPPARFSRTWTTVWTQSCTRGATPIRRLDRWLRSQAHSLTGRT